ncbi:MAG: pyridoxamine 5'-phosphate oxidase family protein [Halanaeroarchaeum sp.]
MAGDNGLVMTDEEIAAYLGRGGTAVLALARGDEPYATPVSYGYDARSRTVYLRLGFGEDGGKAEFLEDAAEARLVAYGPTGDGWASIIAGGTLAPVDDDELTVETARALREGEAPLLDIWGEDLEGAEFQVYRLDVASLSGRSTAQEM